MRESTGAADLTEGLKRIASNTDAFIAVSNGPKDILYLEGDAVRRLPVFSITAVDTIGAGDAFHGGFALALAEGQSEVEAMRFGAAVAGIKCTRLGGSAGTPKRSEVEALTAKNRLSTPVPNGATALAVTGDDRLLADAKTIATGAGRKPRPAKHCSKFRRQIAVDLKADAHFNECRSCP